MLNYILLIACACIVFAITVYLFYWNRVVGYLLGLVLRVALWNQGVSSIWVEIGSLHVSVLAGRIQFKDLRYHSSNMTIQILKGHVSWRYWIRGPANEEDLSHARLGREEFEVKASAWPLSCRIHASLQGLECYIYNRTAAYDSIISQMNTQNHPFGPTEEARFSHETDRTPATPLYPPSLAPVTSISIRPPGFAKKALEWVRRQLPSFDPKELLPIGIEANKAAIVIGNASTPNLLVVEFQKAEGTFGIVPSRSKYDLHKQLLNLKLQNARVHYVENADYQEPMTDAGHDLHDRVQKQQRPRWPRNSYLSFAPFYKLWRRFKLYDFVLSSFHPHTAPRPNTHGSTFLPRIRRAHPTLVEETPVGIDCGKLEYASADKMILEAPELEVLYYVDSAGPVPQLGSEALPHHVMEGGVDVGNGDLAPEWGVEIIVRGGFWRYGPWADRQRAELQRAFFPPTFQDNHPTARLRPGEQRLWTSLKVFIELREGTTFHVPFREPSKDWQWDGKVNVPRPRKREPGHFHIKAGDGSTISYVLPMVAGTDGYESQLEVHLDTVAVTSSLNDIRLLSAESCRIRAEMPSPLKWNAERQWRFAIFLRQPVLYLIRDHINMFTDLGKDWSSGPPSDYYRFVPVIYVVDVDMRNYELNTYANDHNIIDKPLVREENAILTFKGTSFRTNAEIRSNKFRPLMSTVPFTIEAPNVLVVLTLPKWNTRSFYDSRHQNEIGHIGLLRLDGSYLYFADVRKENVEQLKLNFTTRDVVWKAFGWTVRHFMIFRENYFGTFTQFSTLYEYLDKRKKGTPVGDPIELKYREGKSNSLQVELQLSIQHAIIALPVALMGHSISRAVENSSSREYGIGPCVMLTLSELQVELRTHDHCMEMSLNIDALSGGIEDDFAEKLMQSGTEYRKSAELVMIDDVNVVANRLFGPLPRTSTYVCVWEVRLGHLRAMLSPKDQSTILAAGRTFGLNYSDILNAPAAEYTIPTDPDVTFLKFSLGSLDISLTAGTAAVELMLPQGLRIDTNDLAGPRHRKVTSVRLPRATVKVLVSTGALPICWLEAAELVFDANLDMYSCPIGWRETGQAQIDFISSQDSLTGRVRSLYDLQGTGPTKPGRVFYAGGVYLPHPRLPTSEELGLSARTPRRQPMSGISRISESDGEDGVSVRDRDSRIADLHSVSSTPYRYLEDDESVTSGDESDDADLTENGELTDSDDTDFDNESSEPWGGPLLRRYNSISRRYDASCLVKPSLWDGSPFVLIRDCRPSMSFQPEACVDDCLYETETHNTKETDEGTQDDEDTTRIRLQTRNATRLWLSPLIVRALTAFCDSVENHRPLPERYLDEIWGNYVQFKPGPSVTRQRMKLDVDLSPIHVRLTQITPTMAGEPGSTTSLADVHTLNHPRNQASCVDIHLDGCRVWNDHSSLGDSAESRSVFKASFRRFTLVANPASGRRTRRNAADLTTGHACHISVLSFDVRTSHADIRAQLGSVSVNLGHRAPQVVEATALVVGQYMRQLQHILKLSRDSASLHMQQTLYKTLELSKDKSIVNPLSTNQPSYLVQTGRSQELRTSMIFQVQVHLRQCLRQLEDHERETLHTDPQGPISLEQFMSLLQVQSAALVMESDDPTFDLLFLEKIFPASKATYAHEQRPSSRFSSVSVSTTKFSLALFNAVPRCHSQLSLGSVSFSANLRPSELVSSVRPNKALTSVSSKDLSRQPIKCITVGFALAECECDISPHLMGFAHNAIRVHRYYSQPTRPGDLVEEVAGEPLMNEAQQSFFGLTSVDVTVILQSLRLRAAAESLTFEFGVKGVTLATSVLARPLTGIQSASDLSMNHSLNFDEVFLRALSTAEMSKPNDQAVLSSLLISNGRVSAVLRSEPTLPMTLRTTIVVTALQLRVPRSALRLYRFLEEWKADFLPGVESMVQSFLAELKGRPQESSPSETTTAKKPPVLQGNLKLSSFGISLQIMSGTWLSWEINSIMSFVRSSMPTPHKQSHSFGMELGSQIITMSSRPNVSQDSETNNRVRLQLPTVTIAGQSLDSDVHVLASVEFFSATLKPSHWDALLFVQQKFGQDFDDLMLLIQKTRTGRSRPPSVAKTPTWKYSGSLRMKGFRIGLEGISSTLYLECDDIDGRIHNELDTAWSVTLSDLGLSLATRARVGRDPATDRRYRCAFVSIDVQASSRHYNEARFDGHEMELTVTKIHAVMQPSSIGEVGDFVDHLQAELLLRKEERAAEMAAFRRKTINVMRTFEVKANDPRLKERSSWLDKYNIKLSIKNVGVVFPLAFDHDLDNLQDQSEDARAVRAFIFSIKSISFDAQRGEKGEATMKGFAFQFVSRFRQSVPSDFSGDSHRTQNRLVYPEMTAQLRLERSLSSRRIRVAANVSGFVLDLHSSIPEYVFSLVDVYREGKERMGRLTASVPRNLSASQATPRARSDATETQYSALPTSNVLISLTFLSGKVRLHSGMSRGSRRRQSLSAGIFNDADDQSLEMAAEILNLPVVTVWGEYRATPASRKLGAASRPEPSILMFRATIHSSQNVLRPTLIPFLTEIVQHVEDRMRTASWKHFRPLPPQGSDSTPIGLTDGSSSQAVQPVSGSLEICLSLRIDQSKLELTCQPDVNVIAGLHWDSGGFVVNISPGARQVTFTASVGGLTAGLKHGFLSEDCARLDARNLAFSMTFSKVENAENHFINSMSFVLDTEFAGGVRFSRLQDVFCFKAVWLDRIPVITGQTATIPSTPSKSTIQSSSGSATTTHDFTTAVLVRIRQIKLDVDLGQSISSVSLDLQNVVIRTRLTEAFSELSLSIADVAVAASGNLSGQANVPDCLFRTMRRRESSSEIKTDVNRMLEMSMTSGILNVVLESEHRKLLQYYAEPLRVLVYDDWSLVSPQIRDEDRPLRLSFIVSGSEADAIVTVGTIPRLVSYANKFRSNLEAQREGASRESKAFRIAQQPKPDNPLSAVASAMIQSARTRFKETETRYSYLIQQHMSLQLDVLRLVVFPRAMYDPEVAQFVGHNVRASLDRMVESAGLPAKRNLHLAFQSMTISRFTQLNHALLAREPSTQPRQWLSQLMKNATEAIIFSLPAMNMTMISEEVVRDSKTILIYDFYSKFMRQNGLRSEEDIYITLNVALYSWLTVLRKNYAREMEQVHISADLRAPASPTAPITPRRKGAEKSPLSVVRDEDIWDPPRSPQHSTELPIRPGLPMKHSRSLSAYPASAMASDNFTPESTTAPASPSKHFSHGVPDTPKLLRLDSYPDTTRTNATGARSPEPGEIVFEPRDRHIERLTMRQLGEATPDVMHPFFMKKAGFRLEDSLPQYVHEYATAPLEEIMKALLELYSKQLRVRNEDHEGSRSHPMSALYSLHTFWDSVDMCVCSGI